MPLSSNLKHPLLEVQDLSVRFGAFAALEGINLELLAGQTMGLVGESGSGKSTLARAILRLIPATSGRVVWEGKDILTSSRTALRGLRRDLQMIFQDPLGSLDPRMTVGDTLAEPFAIFEPKLASVEKRARVSQMLERVGLASINLDRYPQHFSGGQCQRIGIARAMMLRPKLLLCDEPVSSLDASIQGQIVNLLSDLQRDLGTAMLFISHNLAVVRHLSHRVCVIYRGRLVEVADVDALFAAPVHPYTRELLAAVPDPRRAFAMMPAAPGVAAPNVPTPNVATQGAATRSFAAPMTPSAATPKVAARPTARSGCAFADRCRYVQIACTVAAPPLVEVAAKHFAACHRWREVVYS